MRHLLRIVLFTTLAFTSIGSPVRAQVDVPLTAAEPVAPSATPGPSPTPPIVAHTPTPIPMAQVVTQAESALSNLRNIDDDLSSDQITESIADELPVFTRELTARIDENSKILAAHPSLDNLRGLVRDWRRQSGTLTDWDRDLTSRAAQLDHEIDQLGSLDLTWDETLRTAKSSGTPADVLKRINGVVSTVDDTGEKVAKRRAQILELQNGVAEQAARVTNVFASVQDAREEAIRRLFVQDSPPLWSLNLLSESTQHFGEESRSSVSSQIAGLGAYAQRGEQRFLAQALIILVLIPVLRSIKRRIQPLRNEDPSLERAARVFDAPFATAIVLSLTICAWLYPQAPRMLWAIVGAVALVPTVYILRQLIERHSRSLLNALVIFYFVDELRAIAASLPVLSRMLFTVEMLGGAIFLLWLIRFDPISAVPAEERDRLWRAIRLGSRCALVLFISSLIANVLGYVSLSNLVGDCVLKSAYLAVVLYAILRITDGLILIALRVWPLRLLSMVNRHGALFYRRIHNALDFLAALFWIHRTLDLLALVGPIIAAAKAVLTATLTVGSVHLSLGRLAVFGITVWASILLSRFLLFLLDEDVYPRLNLARGLPYAISTMLHYAVLLTGFFIAVAAMGFDMTKFTILAGAFGVGLGFGMQNIVNNFVSGLILLFERPIKVGDVIQMDDVSGVVQSIGIRASIIRSGSGSEIIVPNGKLISDRVTNWTYSNNQRSIVIPVTVASTTDPDKIIALLNRVAAAHPGVSKDPPPQALFVKFGPASLDLEMHAWTDQFTEWEQIRSDLAVAINKEFAAQSISTP